MSSGSFLTWFSRWNIRPSAVTRTARAMCASYRRQSSSVLFSPSEAIISSSARRKTLAQLILTQSLSVYSRPGRLIQWQPTATRWRASSTG